MGVRGWGGGGEGWVGGWVGVGGGARARGGKGVAETRWAGCPVTEACCHGVVLGKTPKP